MPMPEPTGVNWRKSSYSGITDDSSCVEVAVVGSGMALRDSKNPGSATLSFRTGAWRAFLAHL